MPRRRDRNGRPIDLHHGGKGGTAALGAARGDGRLVGAVGGMPGTGARERWRTRDRPFQAVELEAEPTVSRHHGRRPARTDRRCRRANMARLGQSRAPRGLTGRTWSCRPRSNRATHEALRSAHSRATTILNGNRWRPAPDDDLPHTSHADRGGMVGPWPATGQVRSPQAGSLLGRTRAIGRDVIGEEGALLVGARHDRDPGNPTEAVDTVGAGAHGRPPWAAGRRRIDWRRRNERRRAAGLASRNGAAGNALDAGAEARPRPIMT